MEEHPPLAATVETVWLQDAVDAGLVVDDVLTVEDGMAVPLGRFDPRFGQDVRAAAPRWRRPPTPDEGGFIRLVRLPAGTNATIRWIRGRMPKL